MADLLFDFDTAGIGKLLSESWSREVRRSPNAKRIEGETAELVDASWKDVPS